MDVLRWWARQQPGRGEAARRSRSPPDAARAFAFALAEYRTMLGSYPENDEDMFFDSAEGFKKSSAEMQLHESSSATCLLPCGLLPEELEELEGIGSLLTTTTTALIEGARGKKRAAWAVGSCILQPCLNRCSSAL
jgi:hypothetical protein